MFLLIFFTTRCQVVTHTLGNADIKDLKIILVRFVHLTRTAQLVNHNPTEIVSIVCCADITHPIIWNVYAMLVRDSWVKYELQFVFIFSCYDYFISFIMSSLNIMTLKFLNQLSIFQLELNLKAILHCC